jgi:hypothetical protein
METIFKGESVTTENILAAIREFDGQYSDSNSYDSWLEKETYKYALEYRGKRYPCKYILSQATGIDILEFGGGNPTNSVLRKLGFHVVDK